jgi:hypothetical protein
MLLKLNLGPQSSSSDPHEDRRSVPILMVGQDAKSGRQCEEYHRHQQQETTSPSGSIFLNGNVGFTMRDSTVCAEYKDNISILTEDETETGEESRDQLTEMRPMHQPQGSPTSLRAFRRAMCQQGSPNSSGAPKCDFFWGKKDGKSVMSSNDDEVQSVDAYNPFYL